MTDYLAAAAAAAERGEADLHLWVGPDGHPVDYLLTNPGVKADDNGRAAELSQLTGEPVRFATHIIVSGQTERLPELIKGEVN